MDEEQGVFERLTSSNLKMWSFSALRAFNNYISFQKRFSFLLPFSQFPKNVSSSFFPKIGDFSCISWNAAPFSVSNLYMVGLPTKKCL